MGTPVNDASVTAQRLLLLLSLLQTRRVWSAETLAARLGVSARTLRRDVDRLRGLGYAVGSRTGTDGGYHLDAAIRVPPLLFDDDQVVALAVALCAAPMTGLAIDEAAARALTAVRQVLPSRLQQRIDAIEVTAVVGYDETGPVSHDVLLTVGAAIRRHEELRFDYLPRQATGLDHTADTAQQVPRQVQPHHLIARRGRWYLIAWAPHRGDWRTYRVDRIRPHSPNGPRFDPRPVPGGAPEQFMQARMKGTPQGDRWRCHGEVILHLPIDKVAPFIGDGSVEPLDSVSCRVGLGAWSWIALAATLSKFDAEIDVIDPHNCAQHSHDSPTVPPAPRRRDTSSPRWPGSRSAFGHRPMTGRHPRQP